MASAAVYLKPLAEGETRATVDGASWATAYSDVATAIEAAAGTNIYAAQGVYIISATITPSVPFAIYGGFPGLSDDETLADRDADLCQTILTGDTALDDKWVHIVPKLGQYGVTSTTTDQYVIQNGRIVLPPAYTADYDVYYGNTTGSNTANAFKINASGCTSALLDGIWYTGFVSSGNFGSFLYVAGTRQLTMNNCRQVDCKGGARGIVFFSNSGASIISNCFFMHSTGTESIAIRSSNGNLSIHDCVFRSLYRTGASTCGMGVYAANGTPVADCVFDRFLDTTTSAGSSYGGMGVISGGDGGQPYFIRCAITNNLCMTTGQYGSPLIAKALLLKDCLIADNRYEVKPTAGRGYALVGYASASQTWHMLIDGTVFRRNVIAAPAAVSASGTFYLGMVGQNVVAANSGQRFSLVNCVFDSNVATTSVDTEYLTPRLCRGPYVLNPVANGKAQIGVVNCTFTGPFAENVYDIAQFGEDYASDIPVVNSVFTVTDADVASNWLQADSPLRIAAHSCTVKNLVEPPSDFGACENLLYDDIPLGADYRPLAWTPGLRETADISTNTAHSASAPATFGYSPFGSQSWLPLLSTVNSSVSAASMTKPIGDRFGESRPFGASTRGAVQTLSATAESGVTLTIRREPLASGALTGAPNAQSVAAGAAIAPVTAVPASGGIVFSGWYGTNGVLFSAANPLTIPSLTSNLVLVASFESPRTRLTFNLGGYGVFTANNSSTITIEANYLDAFPAIPEFTLDPAWHAVGWGVPDTVPNADATYTLQCVSSSLRTIFVVPEDEAPSVQDGTSWATAYTNIADAIADAGRYRGQVFFKTGVYKVREPLAVLANVAIRGGFDGSGTSADDADPDANPTILTGDINGDDYWLVNGASPAAANRTPVFAGSDYNPPNPHGTDNYWFAGGNSSDNTDFCFMHTSSSATNAVFSGLTIALFRRSGFKSTAEGAEGVRFESCRFLGCNASRYGNDGGSGDYDTGGVNINGVPVTFSDCLFEGCFWALRLTSGNSVTIRLHNCTFHSNAGSAKACTVRTFGAAAVEMDGCRFFRNCSDNEKHESATCLVLGGGLATFRDCVFEDNRCRQASGAYGAHGIIMAYGGSSVFERCSFIGNDMNQSSSYNYAGLVFCAYGGESATHLVRDCYFSGNTVDFGGSTGAYWGGVISGNLGKWTFLNCTFEDNSMSASERGTCGLFNMAGTASLAIVNCAFRGTSFTGMATAAHVLCRGNDGTLRIVNSAFGPVSGGTQFSLASSVSFGIANSEVVDYADPGCTGSNGFAYEVFEDAPIFRYSCMENAGGLKALPLSAADKNSTKGRPVWLVGREAYIFDETANASKPWRKLTDRGSFAASVDGIDPDDPAPDAFGNDRRANRYPLGPLNPLPSRTLLMLQ